MKIKLLEEKDYKRLQEVFDDDNMVLDKKNIKVFLKTKNSFAFVAQTDDDKIVGFAYGYSLVRPDGKTMFYLHSISVLPEYQNQGTGTKMMNFIVDFAKDNNHSEVFVITDRSNTGACKIYEKTGFQNEIEDEVVYVNEFINKVNKKVKF